VANAPHWYQHWPAWYTVFAIQGPLLRQEEEWILCALPRPPAYSLKVWPKKGPKTFQTRNKEIHSDTV